MDRIPIAIPALVSLATLAISASVRADGPSYDCAKAKTAGEHIICADAALSKADRKMTAAYRRLEKTDSPEGFATVRAAQRAWLAYVDKSCGANKPMPEDQGQKNDMTACVSDNYIDRADRLSKVVVLRAGALALEPRMRLLTRTRPSTEESDIYPWLRGAPEAAPFNVYVARTLKLDKRRMDDKELFPFGDEVADMKLSAHRTYSVTRFDTKVVSLQIATFDYTGGAHEAIGETSLNWNIRNAKPIGLGDVFAKGDAWKRFVADYCIRDLKAQNAEHPDRDSVDPVVRDGTNWLFGRDSATLHFTVYTVASFAGGEYDVKIPYRLLKPYLSADAPVP